MNRQDITRSLIELTIDQGIRDMKTDPHRCIRRLADLGRQFSKSHSQDHFFSLIQKILSCEDSPYYDMVEEHLSSASLASIKRFGNNIAYNGWTCGTPLLRRKKAETCLEYPWFLQLSWDPASGHALQELSAIISDHKENGAYCYSVQIWESLRESTKLFDLFSAFEDCAFWLDLTHSDCMMSREQLQAVGNTPNLMVLLPYESPNCRPLAQALLSQHSLFAISCKYREEKAPYVTAPSFINELLSFGSVFLILSAAEGCSPQAQKKAGDSILHARMEQEYPALLMEWQADMERIDRIIYPQT